MKSIRVRRFGGPEVLEFEEIADPSPGPGQVLVRVKAVGINPFEAYMRSGTYPRKPELPFTPGVDAGGIVEAVGTGTPFKPGDRVYTAGTLSGAYAELALCAAAQVHPLPAKASFEQGAALGVPYGTAYHALFHKAKARPGDRVLIHGASGGVGTAAVQIARAAGMRVTGTAGTADGLKLVREQGAHEALNHSGADHFESALKLTGGKGFDVILEMLANVNLGRDLGLLAPFGRVIVVGSRGKAELDPRDAMGRAASIIGMTLWLAAESELREIHAALAEGLDNGTLRPVIGKTFPLAQAAKAHEAVMAPSFGKIVLVS